MRSRILIAVAVLLSAAPAWGLGEPKCVSPTPVQGGFVLEAKGKAAALVVSDADWPGVVRAVGDLSADVGRVSGNAAPVATTPPDRERPEGTPMVYTLHAKKLAITRENAQGFVESDGYVAMEAADTTSRTEDTAGSGTMRWVELPGYGETKSGTTVFPVTAASEMNSRASLEYRMYLYDSGDFELQMTLSPTLNFVPGRGLRFAVSVDDGTTPGVPDGPRTVVDALEDNSDKDWAEAVSDGVRRVTAPVKIASPGYHTLKVWAVDPAVVIERLVLSHGPLKPSYLGPPESFHAGVAGR